MKLANRGFCIECRNECEYEYKKITESFCIKNKMYDFKVTAAYCSNCHSEINVDGLLDLRTKEIDEQYREIEGIVTIDDINKLMELYDIGKTPLSYVLGFGEITITRYLQGLVPSKEYSDIIKKAMESPKYMREMLSINKKKISLNAYEKSMKSIDKLNEINFISDKLLMVISCIFENLEEVTPLALQKLLYFIQGIHLAIYDKPLFNDDCYAWIHGPVYKNVYRLFRDFTYNPIDDSKFIMLKNRYKDLSVDEIAYIKTITDTFGMYNAKTLEKITHIEDPWKNSEINECGILNSEIINKDRIKSYYRNVLNEYDLRDISEIHRYISDKVSDTTVSDY